MQRPTATTHRGHRTRLHTLSLAIVFGLLAFVATEPRQQRVHAVPMSVVHAFLAVP